MPLHIALYQPDIPGNTGTILRLGACFDIPVHIIEPAGFDLSNRALKRAGMDYLSHTILYRHADWEHFRTATHPQRLILFTTQGETAYTDFTFKAGDILLFGRESAGAPDSIHQQVDMRLTIPMKAEARSLNLAISAAMAAGEAMRQIRTNTAH